MDTKGQRVSVSLLTKRMSTLHVARLVGFESEWEFEEARFDGFPDLLAEPFASEPWKYDSSHITAGQISDGAGDGGHIGEQIQSISWP